MNKIELKKIRLDMGLNIKKMAEALQTPYRTYQNWELGTRRIPGILIAAIELMEKKNENSNDLQN